MANIDYKAAYKELVNYIRSAKELWSRETHNMQDKAFQAYCEDNFDVMRACEGLQERYNGMADECANILEESDCIVERMTSEQEQLPTNANGRVSLHLVNLATGACVYDLDCHPSDVPERVWLEMLISEDGGKNTVQVSSHQDHIHQMRMHEWYGFKLTAVWDIYFPYVWRDDSDKTADYGPDIWMAQYRDTALVTC